MTAHLILLFGVFFGAIALRFPIFFAAILAAVTYALVSSAMPSIVLVQSLNHGLDKNGLVAIPLFYLVGTVMNAGGMTDRIVRLANALLAPCRGSLAQINIGSSMLFGGMTGSAVADVSAIGSMLIPQMQRAGYSPAFSAAVTAASAPIGLLIPPSIPMVLFGLFNDAPIDKLFIAGIVPGLLMGVYLFVAAGLIARRRGYPYGVWLGWCEVWHAFRGCIFALLLPIAIITALLGGIATVSEVGGLAVAYAMLVSVFVYRDTDLSGLWRTLSQTAIEVARLLSIIVVAGASIWIMGSLSVDSIVADLFASARLGATGLLALVAIFLVVTGTFIGIGIQLIFLVPVITPILLEAGVPMMQIGMVCVLSSAIGLITPPIGILLFLTASQARSTVIAVVCELVPFMLALFLLLAALVVFPALSSGFGLINS